MKHSSVDFVIKSEKFNVHLMKFRGLIKLVLRLWVQDAFRGTELLSVSILSKLLISPPICNSIWLILTKDKIEQNKQTNIWVPFSKVDIINIIIFHEMVNKPVST